ncbi:MAG TPA: hypothetical protein VHH36_06230 [Candidatus Thermoplasmatota archaeon]|nr:hypothetical protein [Candidatus Thermoplasmatota archaeon]
MATTTGHAAETLPERATAGAWFRAAPAPLRWGVLAALVWAILYPALNLFSGMVRVQPAGSEGNYFVGFAVAAALALLAALVAGWFALRGSRTAQILLVAALAAQAMLAVADFLRYRDVPILVPKNLPVPAFVPAVAVWATTVLAAAAIIALLSMPSVWRHTRGRGLLPQSHALDNA